MDDKAIKKNDSELQMELYDWVQCIVTALLIGIFIFLFIGRIVGVEGSSMVPTLRDGDMLAVSDLFYTPKQGDIVVVETNKFKRDPIVKRVIATAGQTVDIDFSTGIVYVDGSALVEPYAADFTYLKEDFTGEITVPDGCMFLMGDNRNASTDSRSASIGCVDRRCILGKAYIVVFPGKDGANKRDWSRIGSVYS